MSFMLEDARVAMLLLQAHLSARVEVSAAVVVVNLDQEVEQLAQQPVEPPRPLVHPANLAYVLYTSGSTGQPKAAMITHANLSNHMHWMQANFPLSEADCVLQKTQFSFDASVWEFYAPLLVGARLQLARPGGQRDAAYLVDQIESGQVTTLQVVPTLL